MTQSSSNRFSILCVESDLDTFDLVKKSLEEDSLFSCIVERAANIPECLQKLAHNTYHLLLVEQDLENEFGLDLFVDAGKLKKNIPFVLMTSIHDDTLVKDAMKQGVADVIVKSEQHFQELSARLRKTYENFFESRDASEKIDFGKFERSEEERQSIKQLITGKPDGALSKDELTGLYSHSHFYDRIVREFANAVRYQYPVSCLVLDIDHFKSINERWDFRLGDELLKECAELLFENCRLSDFVSRYGGEEFAILAPHVDYQGALELATRLRAVFAERLFLKGKGDLQITVSIGIASYPQDAIEKRFELLHFAEQALYSSKATGRNRVTMYKDIVPVFGKDELPSLHISESKILEFQRRITEISNIARRTYIDASKALIMALEDKDPFTAGHSASVARYSLQVAQALGMSIDDSEVVEHAGLLHDIGKICIPGEVLLKTGKLTFAEFETMRQHPYLGYKILKPIKFLSQEATLVLHHHEWFNGEGYPCKLKGNDIPLGARIISVIDSYDTMRGAGGRYKKTFTVEASVKELIDCAGTQFDPNVVKSFIDVLIVRGELAADKYDKQKIESMIQSIPNQEAA